MTYSFLDATVRCSHCGLSQAISISTLLESEPGTGFRLSSPVEATAVDMGRSHRTVHEPGGNAPMHIVEAWDCARCSSPEWAEVVVRDGRIASIETVVLTPETLDRINYISDAVDELFKQRTGESIYSMDVVRPDWVARLRSTMQPPASP